MKIEKNGLKCPKCGTSVLSVSQTVCGQDSVVRRRKCRHGHIFVTVEKLGLHSAYNDARQPQGASEKLRVPTYPTSELGTRTITRLIRRPNATRAVERIKREIAALVDNSPRRGELRLATKIALNELLDQLLARHYEPEKPNEHHDRSAPVGDAVHAQHQPVDRA